MLSFVLGAKMRRFVGTRWDEVRLWCCRSLLPDVLSKALHTPSSCVLADCSRQHAIYLAIVYVHIDSLSRDSDTFSTPVRTCRGIGNVT